VKVRLSANESKPGWRNLRGLCPREVGGGGKQTTHQKKTTKKATWDRQ